MRTIIAIAHLMLIVGGLNWLAVGIAQIDVAAAVFGGQSALLARVVYVLVGLSAIVVAMTIPRLLGTAIFSDLPRRR